MHSAFAASSDSHSAPKAAAVASGTGLNITILAGVNQRLAISGWREASRC